MNRISLMLAALFLLCTCTYGPHEIYQKEIAVPENPTVKISLSLNVKADWSGYRVGIGFNYRHQF